MVELEVTFWQMEHITSLCSSNKKERKKDRLQPAGIKLSGTDLQYVEDTTEFLEKFCCTLLLSLLELAINLW